MLHYTKIKRVLFAHQWCYSCLFCFVMSYDPQQYFSKLPSAPSLHCVSVNTGSEWYSLCKMSIKLLFKQLCETMLA